MQLTHQNDVLFLKGEAAERRITCEDLRLLSKRANKTHKWSICLSLKSGLHLWPCSLPLSAPWGNKRGNYSRT